jgi:Xaa-Pro aminopeptidase
MPEQHAARRQRVQDRVAVAGADAALITSLVNVRYLTGLVSSNAALLVPADGEPVLATDSRYAGAAARDCPDVELLSGRLAGLALAGLAAGRGLRRLAFEERHLTVQEHSELAALSGLAGLVPFGPVVEELRMVKDEAEIALLARACEITVAAFTTTLPELRPGQTERGFAIALERAMTDLGADKPGFDSIVASGPNGAIPHHAPSSREFAPGDLVTVDAGAAFAGYHADMTRTVALGQPASWQQDIYQLVAAAQQAGVTAARAGAALADVDAAARQLIAEAGQGEHFQHPLGHGVGLEIHEAPTIGPAATGKLTDRVPVTIEPGVYLPGAGGVRIEDTLVVRAGAGHAGAAQVLTTLTTELLVL